MQGWIISRMDMSEIDYPNEIIFFMEKTSPQAI
jgi:hypothetical protein